MNKRTVDENMFRRMQDELRFLQNKNLLTEEQAGSISAAYQPVSSKYKGRDYLFLGLTSLGVLMLGLAIFLLLGFNWNYLAPEWKLLIVIGSLIVTYLAATTARGCGRLILSELLYFFGAILFGVNIWQIAQIYQICSYYPDGIWAWAIGTAALAFFMRTSLIHLLTAVLLVIWTSCSILEFNGLEMQCPFYPDFLIPNAAWSLPLFVLVGLYWSKKHASQAAGIFYLISLFYWAILMTVAWKTSEIASVNYLIGIGGLFTMLGLSVFKQKGVAVVSILLGMPLMLSCLLISSVYSVHKHFCLGEYFTSYPRVVVLFLLLLACFLLVWLLAVKKKGCPFCSLCKPGMIGFLTILLTTGVFAWNYFLPAEQTAGDCIKESFPIAETVLANLFYLMLVGFMIHRGCNRHLLWFWFGVLAFIVWAVIRYFDLFGDFGGMIGASIIFLVIALILFFCAMISSRMIKSNPQPSLENGEQNESGLVCDSSASGSCCCCCGGTSDTETEAGSKPTGYCWIFGTILAILIQFGFLGQMIAMQTVFFKEKMTITVESLPVDPRDMFRGDYVILRYKFSNRGDRWEWDTQRNENVKIKGLATEDIEPGKTVYTQLKQDEKNEKVYIPVTITTTPPEAGSSECWIKGVAVGYSTVRYGIESYYVQEGTGKEYENTQRSQKEKVLVRLQVSTDGRARVAGIQIVPVDKTEKKDDLVSYSKNIGWEYKQGRRLIDAHIHLRGGMTAKKAMDRAYRSQIRSGVLENHGRDWPISSNEKLKEFIDSIDKERKAWKNEGENLLIGIQVNDRDWYKTIDMRLFHRLNFILADTMIMGKTADGKPQKLWLLPNDYKTDKDKWFEQYFQHTLTVLDEPIDILANPTWLPKFIADDYDKYWTDEKMKQVINKAIANGVALEIQAESDYPKLRFIKLAREAGATFSFGTNNFDDKLKKLDSWEKAMKEGGIKPEELWQPR